MKERLADLYSLHEEYVREQASLPQTDDLDAKFRDLTQKRAKREADVYHSQYAQALADVYKRQASTRPRCILNRCGHWISFRKGAISFQMRHWT